MPQLRAETGFIPSFRADLRTGLATLRRARYAQEPARLARRQPCLRAVAINASSTLNTRVSLPTIAGEVV